MARYVDDLVLALPIISGVDWRDPAIVPMPLGDPNDVDLGVLRIAMHTDNGICTPDEDVMQVVRDAVAALNGVVSVIDERRPEALAKYSEMTDLDKDGNAWLTRLLARSGTTEIHPWISHWIESTETWTADRYSAALEERDEFRSEMLTFMEDYDAILCPPAAKPAIPLGTWIDDENEHLFTYTAAYNVTGWPGTVVRGGTSAEGLPIGVQVVARPWREDVSLALAARLEAELGGFQPPSI
jgi:amidase